MSNNKKPMILFFAGPNGSGKSTITRQLNQRSAGHLSDNRPDGKCLTWHFIDVWQGLLAKEIFN